MPNLNSLLYSVITKSGANVNNEFWNQLLSVPGLTTTPIPDDVYNAVENNLMNMEQAKSNSKIFEHFNSQTNYTHDTEMNNAISGFQLDADTVAKIKAEPNLSKRASLLAKTVAENEKKKFNNTELQKEVSNLSKTLREGKVNQPMRDAIMQSRIDAGLI